MATAWPFRQDKSLSLSNERVRGFCVEALGGFATASLTDLLPGSPALGRFQGFDALGERLQLVLEGFSTRPRGLRMAPGGAWGCNAASRTGGVGPTSFPSAALNLTHAGYRFVGHEWPFSGRRSSGEHRKDLILLLLENGPPLASPCSEEAGDCPSIICPLPKPAAP